MVSLFGFSERVSRVLGFFLFLEVYSGVCFVFLFGSAFEFG